MKERNICVNRKQRLNFVVSRNLWVGSGGLGRQDADRPSQFEAANVWLNRRASDAMVDMTGPLTMKTAFRAFAGVNPGLGLT